MKLRFSKPVLPGETMTIEIPRVGRMSVKASVSEHARAKPWKKAKSTCC
mgnify:CR=1 FL=1